MIACVGVCVWCCLRLFCLVVCVVGVCCAFVCLLVAPLLVAFVRCCCWRALLWSLLPHTCTRARRDAVVTNDRSPHARREWSGMMPRGIFDCGLFLDVCMFLSCSLFCFVLIHLVLFFLLCFNSSCSILFLRTCILPFFYCASFHFA